ncbi:MAG: MBOAT family O-acyltransferase [Peptococcaceae bacterium]|nr:MBOAT family O-acyltransferase [Peptococcaceae bacterium]
MLFTSYRFIFFLALLFVLYYTLPRRMQWGLLLAASYFFYSFAGWGCLIFIAVTTVSAWLAALKMDNLHRAQSAYLKEHKESLTAEEKKAYKAKGKKRKLAWFLAALLLNLGILAVLKYTNFAIANLNELFRLFGSQKQLSFANLLLPMGISFYLFQTVGYVTDIYRGKYPPEKNLFKFALFVSFFPQLVQGPISRFDDLAPVLLRPHPFDSRTVTFGLERILWGYFKKLVVADRLLVAVNTIIRNPQDYDGIFVLLGMFFYALELYADFTGGIDITIGIAQTLGIPLKENFIRPYFSKSIEEYWRRWHITMGTWFRDYLFYPVSVSKPMLAISKKSRALFGPDIGKRIPVYLATLLTWFTTGLWHGASWNFILWGVLNGVIIILSQECTPLYARFHSRFKAEGTPGWRLFQVARTFWLMSALRTLDCYRDVPLTFRMLGTIFTDFSLTPLLDGSLGTLGLTSADFAVTTAGCLVMLFVGLSQRSGPVREKLAARPAYQRYGAVFLLAFAVLVFGAYGVGYDASQFIYNQF